MYLESAGRGEGFAASRAVMLLWSSSLLRRQAGRDSGGRQRPGWDKASGWVLAVHGTPVRETIDLGFD